MISAGILADARITLLLNHSAPWRVMWTVHALLRPDVKEVIIDVPL